MSRALLVLAAALGVLLIYYPALSGPFLLDDLDNIESTTLHHLDWSELIRVAGSNDSGALGRPLPVLSLALNQYFSGLETTSYKVINLMLHLLNGLILYFLLIELTSTAKRSVNSRSLKSIEPQNITWVAGAVALIWLIHPLQVSGVMYVVQRMNIMSTVFVLLSLLVYVRLRLNVVSGPVEFSAKLAGTAFFVVLAAMSKENGILAPVYLLIVEWIFFRFSAQAGLRQTNAIRWLYCCGASLVFLAVVYFVLNPELMIQGYVKREFTLAERLMTQPFVVWNYLGQILVPRMSEMSLYQDDFPVAKELSLSGIFILSVFVFALLLATLVVKRFPLVTLGVYLYFASHLLESTFVPLEMSFEHRNYFGLFGVVLSVVGLTAWALRHRGPMLLRSILTIVVLVLGVQTWQRAIEWSSELTHNAIAAESRPMSRRAQISYANTLARSERIGEAVEVLEKGRKAGLDPVYLALAIIDLKSRFELVETADVLAAADMLSQHPVNVSHALLLLTLQENVHRGKVNRPSAQELVMLFTAVQESPKIRLNDRGRATMLRHLATRLVVVKHWEAAQNAIDRALELNHADVQAQRLKVRIDLARSQAELID